MSRLEFAPVEFVEVPEFAPAPHRATAKQRKRRDEVFNAWCARNWKACDPRFWLFRPKHNYLFSAAQARTLALQLEDRQRSLLINFALEGTCKGACMHLKTRNGKEFPYGLVTYLHQDHLKKLNRGEALDIWTAPIDQSADYITRKALLEIERRVGTAAARKELDIEELVKIVNYAQEAKRKHLVVSGGAAPDGEIKLVSKIPEGWDEEMAS